MEVIMGIKDLIRQGNVKEVAEYLEQNRLSPQELSELRSFAEGAGRTEMLSFLDSVLAPNGRKDSDSSGNSSTISSNIPGVNYDIEKAYEYLEKLEKKYTEEQIEKIHQNVKFLMNKTLGANKFAQGFKDAMDAYHSMTDDEYFTLIRFVQEFYEECAPSKYYPEEARNHDFILLVHSISDEMGQEKFCTLLGDSNYHATE
jgi:hypothetical protein